MLLIRVMVVEQQMRDHWLEMFEPGAFVRWKQSQMLRFDFNNSHMKLAAAPLLDGDEQGQAAGDKAATSVIIEVRVTFTFEHSSSLSALHMASVHTSRQRSGVERPGRPSLSSQTSSPMTHRPRTRIRTQAPMRVAFDASTSRRPWTTLAKSQLNGMRETKALVGAGSPSRCGSDKGPATPRPALAIAGLPEKYLVPASRLRNH